MDKWDILQIFNIYEEPIINEYGNIDGFKINSKDLMEISELIITEMGKEK